MRAASHDRDVNPSKDLERRVAVLEAQVAIAGLAYSAVLEAIS